MDAVAIWTGVLLGGKKTMGFSPEVKRCHSCLLLDPAAPMIYITRPVVSALDKCDVRHRSRVPEVGLFVRHSAALTGDHFLLSRLGANNAFRDFETRGFLGAYLGLLPPSAPSQRHWIRKTISLVFTFYNGVS